MLLHVNEAVESVILLCYLKKIVNTPIYLQGFPRKTKQNKNTKTKNKTNKKQKTKKKQRKKNTILTYIHKIRLG